MKLLHLTPKRNYNSIIKWGLKPSKIKNDYHLNVFQDDGLDGDKVTYFWDPNNSGGNNDKIIKDFIYCKHFIHPRNEMFDHAELLGLDYIDFKKLGPRLFGEEEDYVLLEVDSKDINLINDIGYLHSQYSEDDDYSSTGVWMDPKYEHDNKELQITDEVIFNSNIKLVNEISTRIYKDNTIGVTYKGI